MKTVRIIMIALAGSLLIAPVTSLGALGTNVDLAIGKTVSTNLAKVGDVLLFQLTVTNLGPVSATAAVVADVLPSGFQYISSSGAGSYSQTTSQWHFSPGSPGAISILTITVLATNAGIWVNSAVITSSVPPDNNFTNNMATAGVTVNSITNTNPPIVLTCPSNITAMATSASGVTAFFSVTASGGCNPPPFVTASPPSGSTFPMGTTIVTTMASDSCGNSTNCSFNVTVVRPPILLNCPSNLTVTATSSNGAVVFFTATASGGCNPPPLVSAFPPSGSTFPIGTSSVMTTASDTCGTSTNCSFTVTVNPPSYPPIMLTCSSNLKVTASGPSGAVVFFTVSASGGCSPPPFVSASPPSGSTFPIGTTMVTSTASDTCGNSTNCSFTVSVVSPTMVLTCPSNITVTASGSNGAVVFFTATATGGCNPPPLVTANPPSGSTFPIGITMVMTTASDTCGSSTNCNFTVTVNSPANPTADLQITKSANPTNLVAGQTVIFTVALQNLGPNDVTNNIVVTDCLPSGLQYVTDSNYGGGGMGTYSPGTCWWSLTGLGVNATVYLTITALAANGGVYTNTASVTAPTGYTDPNPSNNTAFAVVAVTQPTADLQITKSVSTNSAKVFQGFNFYIAVTNVGSAAVTNFVGNDLLPAGLSYVYWLGYGATNQNYNPSNGVWNIASILPGQGYLLSLGAMGTAPGSFTNTAKLISSVPADTNAANNTASATITIWPLQADLAVTKTVLTNTLPVFSSSSFNFILTVTNLGPDTVTNLTLTDVLPAGLPYAGSVNNAGSSYTASNGLWTFSVPLAAGQGASMSIQTYDPTPGAFTNTVRVNVPASVKDPNTNNNSASAIVNALPVYRVTGYVANCSSNGVLLANITVKLTGAANQITTTSFNGGYSFNAVSNGVYTLTPSQPGNVFVPAIATVTVSNANVVAPTFVGGNGLIYGLVSYFGLPITNQLVRLTGDGLPKPRLALTDINGYYLFTNTPTGNYIVTAVATNGYVFTPTNPAVVLDATNCAAVTNFSATTARVVQLVALEVVQVIQDWSNSVRLIQGKETYVRGHFQVTNNNPVLLQGARLYNGNDSVSPLPSGQLLVGWTNASLRPIRENLTNSLNFRLPREWLAGALSLRFACTNQVTVVPTNLVPANSTVQVSFVPAPALPIRLFSVHWTNAGVAASFQQNSAANLADVPRRLLSMYPVPSVDCQMASPLIMNNTSPPPYEQINAQLLAIRTVDEVVAAVSYGTIKPPGKRIYHGAVAGSTFYQDTGIAELPGFIGSGLMPPNNDFYGVLFLRHLATHEIGHNLGRQHTASAALFGTKGGEPKGGCGEVAAVGTVYPLYQSVAGVYVDKPAMGPMNSGSNALVYGLDTLTLRTAPQINPVASPYVYFDVMSYCGVRPLSWWISTYNYNGVYAYATNTFKPPPGPPAPGPLQNWMLVRGTIDLTLNSAAFLPTLEVTTPFTPASPPPGPYALVLFDTIGNIIGQVSFQPQLEEGESGADDSALFMIPVLANPAIHEMAIWNGTNFVADVVGSVSQPSVSAVNVTATNGGAFSGSGQMNLSWTASDAHPNAQLTFMILYSADAGTNWQTLVLDWSGRNYALDSALLPASSNGVIQVTASDGFNVSSPAFSGQFAVANHPPTMSINSPMNGMIFIADEQIFLDASADDPLDGPLDSNNVQWVSSRDGILGHGTVLNFEAAVLSEGSHLITATATDSLGLTNNGSVTVIIVRRLPPALAIELTGSQVLLSWPSSATNYILESTTSLLPATWSAVTNAPVAADIIQTVSLNLSNTNRFFRLRLP